jgi:spore coat polysaccharide biosynthesis predicted glycosyltransferase SpsG
MNGRLFFRADAAPEMGLGHVRRCAVLAQACREPGAEIHLIARWRDVAIESAGDWTGVRIHEMPWELTPDEDAQWVVNVCREFGIGKGVLDHYRLPGTYQERLGENGLEWMQFGNTGHAHPLLGRWVHDASPGAEMTGYVGRVTGARTEFLLGPRYALVSEGFREAREASRRSAGGAVKSVLVTFGGGGGCGATLRALGWLDGVGFAGQRVVLTGAKNPSAAMLQERAREDCRIELEVGNWSPAQVMSRCQLAICAGGTSLHELACLGIPALAVSLADNQRVSGAAWEAAGLGSYLGDVDGLNDEAAECCLRSWLENAVERDGAVQRCLLAQDGLGAERVARVLAGVV